MSHALISSRERQIGTYLFGRKMYETLAVWERTFEADIVRELKAGATREVAVGGPALAAHAIRAGLVDEYHLLVAPIIAGSGNP